MTSPTLASAPFHMIRLIASKRWLQWGGVALAVAAVIGSTIGAGSPPVIPPIALSAEPLYAKGARAKPTMTLALSVEFPTVGAQYVASPGATDDATYSTSNEYLGYFDPTSCYRYNDNPQEARPAGVALADYKRFDRTGAASNHVCSDAFSGNFMNWAGSSAVDILRYALTGGDRAVDTSTLTVLQRAVLPAGRFWNDSNFPSKQISHADAVGALPSALLGSTTGTIYVASCYNRIHFGTQKSGSCTSPGSNGNLGVGTSGPSMGPITNATSVPGGYTNCAGENGSCSFTGTMRVYYGANSSWRTAAATGPVACSNGVFGDPISGTYKQCFVGPDTIHDWTPPTTTGALTADAFFYDRVSVCDVDAQKNLVDPRSDLCLKYPAGNFKPIGTLQTYSDSIRVAAFGYLNDSTGNPNERYGGVLRAPMKYIGAKSYDNNFTLVPGVNPNREWDETTGVFLANPDSQTTPSGGGSSPSGPPLSGVTNYLNQFGRTGNFGSYKTYDPVGELYYEALRYLQGLPPTAAATSGLTTDMMDGYPVYTSWADPHPAVSGLVDYSCVKNNIVAIGDVNTHNDKSLPGNPASRGGNENPFSSGRASSIASNEPDFHYWTQVVGGFESANAVSYVDGKGVSRTTSNFNSSASPQAPFPSLSGMADANIGADAASYYMAGAAYWANTHDIRGTDWSDVDKRRPGMRVKTYVLDVNEFAQQTAPSQHRKNQFYLASKYGGFDDSTGGGNPYVNSSGGSDNTSWERSGVGNQGETNNYYLASSAAAVIKGLKDIFADASKQANNIAGAAASTTRLTGSGAFIYQGQFVPGTWDGNVLAYRADVTAGNAVNVAMTPTWDAASTLAATGAAARNIVVGKTTSTSAATATPFLWTSLDPDAQASLQSPQGTSGGAPTSVAAGQARLDYLRGDRSNEVPLGFGFRKRTSLIGDIVNSGIVFSGAPSQRFNDTAYNTFYSTNKNRKNALFVGANDGMLHALDPDNNGKELFAYIPSWVVPRIGALTFQSYIHQSYVDATPSVGDALVGSAWKTVLVGGAGGGGQGVYALDVSDPSAFDSTKVLWEFNDRDDVNGPPATKSQYDLGNVVGRPQILKLRTGTVSNPAYKYFAVFTSGVNNYVDDGHFSSTGASAIYLLDLSKAPGVAWSEDSNFFKIRFPNPAVGAGAKANGLIGFTVVNGNADEVAQLYAGDLQGNLWKLDFTQATAGKGDWNLNKLSYFHSGSNAIPMYQAVNGSGIAQPITMEPAVVYGPNNSRYIAFGTGKFLEGSDTQGPYTTQSVYALLDNGSNALDTGSSTAAISGRGRLQAGTVNVGAGVVNIPSFVWGRPLSDGDASKRSGWYFDLSTPNGEREISNANVLAGMLQFSSIIPPPNSCEDGDGYVYAITIAGGGGTLVRSPVGLVSQPLVLQVNAAESKPTDSTGRRIVIRHYQTTVTGVEGVSSIGKMDQPSFAGRLNWREVSNYQQMKNATAPPPPP